MMTTYYDYDNSDDDNIGNKHKYQQQHSREQTERKPSPMLNTMRKRRAANIFNENYVTDAQNNGKWMCNLIRDSLKWEGPVSGKTSSDTQHIHLTWSAQHKKHLNKH